MFNNIISVYNKYGVKLVSYEYNAWGLSFAYYHNNGANTSVVKNPYTYRGYYYDSDLGLYYLQSRYYDPNTCRFISADCYLSTGQGLLGYNMFAYCNNNPVMGYDPTGTWDRGGVIIGMSLVIVGVAAAATIGVATPIALIASAAVITTGATMICAAATDSQMVIDVSLSIPIKDTAYVKIGQSALIDFDADEVNSYVHIGGGIGISSGPSYSTGLVRNYNTPNDYSGWFIDVFAGFTGGVDYGWSPNEDIFSATQATTITFSFGASGGVGGDYYSDPTQIIQWGD